MEFPPILVGPEFSPSSAPGSFPVPTDLGIPARPRRRTQAVIARYDSARTTAENRRHWANADGRSAKSANDAETRRLLRTRARYEAAENNSWAWGMVHTLANDTIGTGPRLQLLTEDPDLNRRVERAFKAWCDAVGLAEKLTVMRQARAIDGEAFAKLITNRRLPTAVQLDLNLIEADQVATPDLDPVATNAVDGIVFDEFTNPVEYHVLDSHPGDTYHLGLEYDRIDARFMLHWFRRIRPGQVRGIPDITPALDLFAELRRYRKAVLAAAETAADFAAVLYSDAPPDTDGDDGSLAGETFEIERRVMTTLPAGWKMGQFKAEQPTTTYVEFVKALLNEIARCLNMPLNVALGNSSGYNYASGRLDHQVYFKSIRVDQAHAGRVLLDRIFMAWLENAWIVTDLLPAEPRGLEEWPHLWLWDEAEHVDPTKEATAQETRLRNLMTSFSEECQRQGVDPEMRAQTIAKDRSLFGKYGIPLPSAWSPTVSPQSPPGGSNADQSDEE